MCTKETQKLPRNSILRDRIIGHYFIHGNVIEQTYIELLDRTVNPRIIQLLKDDDRLLEGKLIFQQDGVPSYIVTLVRQFLEENFAERWIRRR